MSKILGYVTLFNAGSEAKFFQGIFANKKTALENVRSNNEHLKNHNGVGSYSVGVLYEVIDYWSKEGRDLDKQELNDPLKGTLDEMK